MKKPFIFITNDDGVAAKGLAAVIEVARRHGDVFVIAPEVSQSGKSHSITMYNPLYLRTVRQEPGLEVYACTGTPVDCVKLAFDHMLADRHPDLTISGINHGSNSAISVLYSGTMGAAIEASFYGSPAIGFSLTDYDHDADFTASALIADKIINTVLHTEIELPLCLNVNIPAGTPEEIKGIRVCRQNEGYWKETFVCRKDPRGKDYYWLTGSFHNTEPDSTDTDEWALANGYVSVVPVQVDMTNHRQVTEIGRLLDE
ncbi:5'/3'-nucleotidase SurE [Alistipes sp. OttesenSCG-928-B03]|nr:5'/3'-nucleotidase SurE [Alistipes sp. OttesenSCG-928-B03]